MAGVFFSSPYLKGGKQSAKLANLTKYISTREGVELLKDTDSGSPATKQQQDFISRLLKVFPDTREMPEYAQVSTTLDIYTHGFDKNKIAASYTLHNALEI